MSASLVGSEMCIRDRFAERFPDPMRQPCGCNLTRFVQLDGMFVHIARSVSYTHLTLPTICSV
eukprot:4547514-Alexandrium_andersonii.AAC.1